MKDFVVIHKPSINVVGIECRTSNAPDAGPLDIPQLWERFMKEDIYNKIPNKASDEVIGLYCDYESDFTQSYSLVVGCPVLLFDNIPEGMVARTIPASSYALFRAIGEHPKSLIETWQKIWQTDLKRTYSGDFELYGEKFMSGSPKEIEVYIAIES